MDGEELFEQDGPGLFEEKPAGDRYAPDAPLALYRRYRPEVFSEVIGQEHVTEPLKRALTNNRVNHAYLFSGPRGCGKTSSARILARSLNCEQGPTPNPCGVCDSCRDLSRSGGGSIDVIEIDAASHGGVDDARDLRERAFFAPVRSRYKIYIVDEAHMVTTAGFNALLKLVEEPPPHVKFIFATTEPDKVIGTIRSRTHHYPFRLIPPKTLAAYLTTICEEEKVKVEPGVIPMVVRAGAGSVRDSLSVLDQLLGGAETSGVGHAQAAALLGYTPDSLLDEAVDAFAESDSRRVFSAIDKVIESGQDPRRFTEDLLRRLRDLVIVAAVPDAFSTGLLEVSEDQGERFTAQAQKIGIGGLTRASEILAAGLVAMRGTTAPRLNLELMCSRILLPGADAGERGLHARLEKLERRLDVETPAGVTGGSPLLGRVSDPSSVRGPAAPSRPVTTPQNPGSATGLVSPPLTSDTATPAAPLLPTSAAATSAVPTAPASSTTPDSANPTAPAPVRSPSEFAPPPGTPQEPSPTAPQPPTPTDPTPPTPISLDDLTTESLRVVWPSLSKQIQASSRYLGMVLSQFATVTELRDKTLWLTFSDSGPRDGFKGKNGEDLVSQVISEHVGAKIAVRARLESEPIPDKGGTAILFPVKESGREPTPVPTQEPSLPFESSSASQASTTAPTAGGSASHTLETSPTPSRGPSQPTPAPRFAPRSAPEPIPTPEPDSEPDAEPDIDNDIVLEGSSQAEELVEEIFEAEFVKEEKTKPRTRAPRKKSA